MASKFEEFCNALAFLQQDQPVFVSQVDSGEFVGLKHQQLVTLGSKMLKNLLKLAKRGEEFANTLPPDFLERLTHAIQEYYKLFYIKPKVFGGLFSSCTKQRRQGNQYEQRLSIIKAKVVSATFLPIGILVDAKAEILNVESVKYSEYIARMNDIFSMLNAVITKGNESVRQKAKHDLYGAMESVKKFVEFYCDNDEEFIMEARRRLRNIKDILKNNPQPVSDDIASSQPAKPPPTALNRRSLVKVQSGLQEIMNSAALISLNKSKTSLYATDDIQQYLKRERDAEVELFTALEDEMHDEASVQILHRLREESEIVFNDANNKLREAGKRWNNVKGQSHPRPVAVIEEPLPAPPTTGFPPAQSLATTGKEIGNIGKKAANEGKKIATDAASGVKDMVQFVTADVGKGVVTGVTDAAKGFGSGAKNIATTALNVGNIAAQLPGKAAKEFLGLDEPPSPSPPAAKNTYPSFDKFPKFGNLLD